MNNTELEDAELANLIVAAEHVCEEIAANLPQAPGYG
jgi:hypothetical protein